MENNLSRTQRFQKQGHPSKTRRNNHLIGKKSQRASNQNQIDYLIAPSQQLYHRKPSQDYEGIAEIEEISVRNKITRQNSKLTKIVAGTLNDRWYGEWQS